MLWGVSMGCSQSSFGLCCVMAGIRIFGIISKPMTDTSPTPSDSRDAAPKPSATVPAGQKSEPRNEKPRLDPVRYGDWEKNGRCIDF